MNKVKMIIAGVAIIGVAGYVVAKTMKNSDTENKVESENTIIILLKIVKRKNFVNEKIS